MIALRGYVLAGGGSRRFGADKARALLRGKPLVVHAAEVVEQACGDVAVVSAPERSYEDLGLRTIVDEVVGLGPLSGLHTALTDAGTGFVMLAACDFIGAKAEWLEQLAARARPGRGVAFRDEHRWHPVFAIYSTELLPEVRRRLADRELSLQGLLDGFGDPVDAPPGFERARSIDTPQALSEYRDDEG